MLLKNYKVPTYTIYLLHDVFHQNSDEQPVRLRKALRSDVLQEQRCRVASEGHALKFLVGYKLVSCEFTLVADLLLGGLIVSD
jgi:hypothetical protein